MPIFHDPFVIFNIADRGDGSDDPKNNSDDNDAGSTLQGGKHGGDDQQLVIVIDDDDDEDVGGGGGGGGGGRSKKDNPSPLATFDENEDGGMAATAWDDAPMPTWEGSPPPGEGIARGGTPSNA